MYEWITGGKCSECGQPFEGLHLATKTTCSTKCRKRRERRQKLQHAVWIDAMHVLSEIRDAIKRGEDVAHHISTLNRLKGEINDLLLLAKDADALARQEMFAARARRF